jgi:hypothetical protein
MVQSLKYPDRKTSTDTLLPLTILIWIFALVEAGPCPVLILHPNRGPTPVFYNSWRVI